MSRRFDADRRQLLAAAFGVGATTAVSSTLAAAQTSEAAANALLAQTEYLVPNAPYDQSAALQEAVDRAADAGLPLLLAPGAYLVSDIRLRPQTKLLGPARSATLVFSGGPAFLTADRADGLVIRGVALDGQWKAYDAARGEGLISITRSRDLTIEDVDIRHSAITGLSLVGCSGRVASTTIIDALDAGLKSLDGEGLDFRGVIVKACANNGILVWRSAKGADGTTVTNCRIANIRNASGGTGQFGNGVNVFRAGGVLVANNRISDCAYSAIRANAADNVQIVANSCERLGEVALYAEFGFEGAVIANNIVDGAATGISVTNFNEGGRLAVVQGNLIRNLFRRENEPVDKRGEGIGVEADAVVSGNTIEGAPTVGIQIGWGSYMRSVSATGNVIRNAKVGVAITGEADGAACLVANNLLSGVSDGAIRRMRRGVVYGADLAREPAAAGEVSLSGNVAV